MAAAGESRERLVVRGALAAGRVPGLVARVLRGVVNGLLLGALSDRTLRELDEHYYTGEEMYRTAEWNEQGLFAWEEAIVAAHFPAGAQVAVVGAGGGREVLALLGAGYEAV